MSTATPSTLDSPFAAVIAACLTILVLTLAACGGDDPSGPDQPTPNVVGSYPGDWTYILAYQPAGGDQDLVCPGNVTVDSQIPDGTFTGTWTQLLTSEDCSNASGTLSGIVGPGAAVAVVDFQSSGGGSGSTLEDVTEGECVATRFDDGYRGSADGSSFEISYAISGECRQGRAVSWVIAFSGAATPISPETARFSEAPGP